MSLRLPTDPAERKKMLILAAIMSAVALFLGVRFAIMPFMNSMKVKKARLEELEDLLWQADRDIQKMEKNQRKNADTINAILDISEDKKYILQPSLGNYLLVAEAQLKDWGTKAGVKIENIRQLSGPPRFDPAQKDKGPAFAPYALAIQLQEGLHDMTRFVHLILKDNPYVTITSIVINRQPTGAAIQHSINMTIQWPIWRDPLHPNQLSAELLADEDQQ